MKKTTPFVETLRGKIVIAFALIIVAAGIMWAVNKVAFEKITAIVHDLSTPNDKLNLSRKLTVHVSNLAGLQQAEVRKGGGKVSPSYTGRIKEISNDINSLRSFFLNEPHQLVRIDSVSSLLQSDNKLFKNYLQLSYEIEKKKEFERQLQVLSYKIDSEKIKVDSNVVTNERKVVTTTVIPTDTMVTLKKKKSWIKRLFSKPTEETIIVQKEPRVQIEEELKTTVDTLSVAKSDTSPKLGKSLRQIQRVRAQRFNKLEATEAELLNANDVLIQQIQNILNEVEKQELAQVKSKTDATVLLAGETISHTRLITIILGVIIFIFAVLMIAEVGRSRRYRKEIEAAKAEAEYHSLSKQRFLANMSHEIRTPLQSIIGYSEQQLQENEGNKDNINAIHQSSKHLLQIVNEVLDYSRITSGKFTFQNTIFNVRNVITEVVSGIQPLAEKKSLKLILETNSLEAVENINGDPFRLKQVLFNLLGNAIKFTEHGTVKLAVTSTIKDKQVVLSFVVEDTGIGMSEHEVKNIFNQFEQAGEAQFRQGGTGLGLTIVKELVEAQQGNITVQSEPGKGSKFQVTLPFVLDDASRVDTLTLAESNPIPFEGKVWLVDDDELILRLSSIILTRHNIDHICFNNAEKLLKEPWDERVKVVFADIRLPGINGTELCRLLRKKIPADTKIIAMTAQVLPEEKESLSNTGFDDLLLKPFVEADILRALNQKAEIKPVNVRLDVSKLAQMLDNKEQLNEILRQCYEETTDDLTALSVALGSNDQHNVSLIIHRLAGRIGQMGEKSLARKLRQTEAAIRRDNDLKASENEIKEILTQIAGFIQLLKSEIETGAAEIEQK